MKFQFNTYQRRFKQPLHTSHGIWQVREGIVVGLSDGKNIARGEIAPLSWFGSETMDEALEFCQDLPEEISRADIVSIPDSLPACQFALESAWLDLQSDCHDTTLDNLDSLDFCYLLPTGVEALTAWQKIHNSRQNTTFKWKIGVYPLSEEMDILRQLLQMLPPKIKLRLDANGSLDLAQTKRLLSITDSYQNVEFIEQPLSPKYFTQMLQLSREHHTPLALDESVASFAQLKSIHQQGWQGIFVIKASIAGFPNRLRQYCQQHSLDVVFSSVFETDIGRSSVLRLAQKLNHPRALGLGVDYFV
ncbi:MAG: o-succinylbenzoate synthase [Cyanobacteria bacterium P01_G01_bin.19]